MNPGPPRTPARVEGAGMVTCVGLDRLSASAAIRAGLSNFNDTRYHQRGTEDPLIGAPVPGLVEESHGLARLAVLLARAVAEALQAADGLPSKEIPILVGVPEAETPGLASQVGPELLPALAESLGHPLHPLSGLVPRGKTSFAAAFDRARRLSASQGPAKFVLAGVDSLLDVDFLSERQAERRVKTKKNSNGFIPGEAAAAVLINFKPVKSPSLAVCIAGLGLAVEKAHVRSEEPQRGEGMSAAIRQAFTDAGMTYADVDFRLSDVSGEIYGFREVQLAMSRTLRVSKVSFPLLHCSDSIGEVGAAAGACLVAYAATAFWKRHAPGRRALVLLSADPGERAALIVGLEGTGV